MKAVFPLPPREFVRCTLLTRIGAGEEVEKAITPWKIVIFPVVGSLLLIALFYFLNILRYLLIGLVTLSSLSSVAYVVYPYFDLLFETLPCNIQFRTFRLPQRLARWLGISRIPFALPLSAVSSLLFIITWLVTGSWILSDMIAVCLIVTTIVSIQLPSGMIAVLLLSVFWVYDVFWVFISPLIFSKNVMETVASGVSQLELPMLIKLPRTLWLIPRAPSDNASIALPNTLSAFFNFHAALESFGSSGFIMLGLGDIVLPGLVLNYFYRRDKTLQFEEDFERLVEQETRTRQEMEENPEQANGRDSGHASKTDEEEDQEDAPLVVLMDTYGGANDTLPAHHVEIVRRSHDARQQQQQQQQQQNLLEQDNATITPSHTSPSFPPPTSHLVGRFHLPALILRSPWKMTFYFVAQIGYVFGLIMAFLMLIILKRGQPALLYLVPCTLIPAFTLAWKRQQLLWLWKPLWGSEARTMQVASSTAVAMDPGYNDEQGSHDMSSMELDSIHSYNNVNEEGDVNPRSASTTPSNPPEAGR